ncbi:serine hydrolase domain-containing protein [Alteromonas sp. 1_MG-2023]|uniref:serine hydrolase domain-containing protein n=1 Tax=Alteromonas sp. 1_MG-2023 TaxID=3062669 RepID=UPI0026E3D9E9|nr:serine hydrolase domain-containing protein [Alteromonas sp. 1_MG-2023]MDO6477714.1 serine hydrolase domain-containing protein [Alteromonas sp. 1_MG-2023]
MSRHRFLKGCTEKAGQKIGNSLMNKFFRILALSGVAISSAYGAENSPDWSALKSEVTGLFTTQNVPGMSAAVVSQGKIVWKYEAGFVDESRAVPVTIDTPFWIASITKPFVGLAYLHLASAGKVNLNELASSTPDFSDTCNWLKGTSIPFAKGMKCDAAITIDHILHHQINGTPGSEFMYNPIMYSGLSRHLEYTLAGTIKGMKGYHNQLAQAIDKYVLAPAGINDTMASMFDPSNASVYQRMSDGFKVSDDEKKQS